MALGDTRTAAQRREDNYRDTMDAAEYGDALARAMERVTRCPDTCTCRGLARAIDATVTRDPREMRYTTLGVTR